MVEKKTEKVESDLFVMATASLSEDVRADLNIPDPVEEVEEENDKGN